jgi:hypothetical protein
MYKSEEPLKNIKTISGSSSGLSLCFKVKKRIEIECPLKYLILECL